MFGYDKIELSFSSSPWMIILGVIIIGLFSFFVYRFTLPPITGIKKTILIILRSLALLFLLIILFEPLAKLTKSEILEPVNLVFIDNSSSITFQDGVDRERQVKDFLSGLVKSDINGLEFFSFGNNVKQVHPDSLNKINFSETSTNFYSIFNQPDFKDKNIASITILSDGIITDGSNPSYMIEQNNYPVFTIGVGDSSKRKDVEIKSVLHNDFIYAETPTSIKTVITHNEYAGRSTSVSLYEGELLIDQKNVILDESGTNSILFDYTPKESGEKRLRVVVSNFEDEFNKENNRKSFYVNVLSNKVNVLIVSSSPSADLTFVKNSLISDKNLSVKSLTEIRTGIFIEKDYVKVIDSADIFFLIDYPVRESSSKVFEQIAKRIIEKNIPYFISFSASADKQKLSLLQNSLPISITQFENSYSQVQPNIAIAENSNPLLQNNSSNMITAWNSLPPVLQPKGIFVKKVESKLLSSIKIDNVPQSLPLIVTRSFGNSRSISLIAKDFWKWKLQTATKQSDLFDRFIINSVRWLNISEEFKIIRIKTNKRFYSTGEDVIFNAQVFDESLNPVSNAAVSVKLNQSNEQSEVILTSIGSGLYEGTFKPTSGGDHSFIGDAKLNGKVLGEDKGSFNIGEVDVELINPVANYHFLNGLSEQTGGEFYTPDKIAQLIDQLNKINSQSAKEKISTSEIKLWSSEWFLILVILLFSIEWFLRKRFGML